LLDTENAFHYDGGVEGSVALDPARPWAAPMTRCECAELPFDEVARRVREEGASLEEVQERTGCGRLCAACLPDLRSHLAARR
jgi:bacterioferritin-associated ferredoxin